MLIIMEFEDKNNDSLDKKSNKINIKTKPKKLFV